MELYKFPSAFKQVLGGTFLETVKVDGKEYVVGDNAVKNGSHLWDIDSLIKYTPIFLKYLKEIKKENISKIVLSVPTATFANAVKQKKAGKTNTYFDKMTSSIKNTLSDEVKEIKFLPQGVSAIYYYQKEEEIRIGEYVLTIDGGFNTLNLAITLVNTPLDIILNESVFDKGIRTLLVEKFLPLLQSEIADDVPKEFHYLKKVFLKGEIDIGLSTVNIKHLADMAIEAYLDEVMEYITQTIKRNSDGEYNIINIVGGLSYYLKNKIKTSKKIIEPKENGEFLTAIGMLEKYPDHLSIDLGFGDSKIAKNI